MKNSTYWNKMFIVFILLTVLAALMMAVDTIVYAFQYQNAYPVDAFVVSETELGDDGDSFSYVLSYVYQNQEYNGTLIRSRRFDSAQVKVKIDPDAPEQVLDTPGQKVILIYIVLFIAAFPDVFWYIERDSQQSRLNNVLKPCLAVHIVNLIIAVIMIVQGH